MARPRTRIGAGLITGLVVHLIAVGIYTARYAMHLHDCDTGDAIAAAAATAAGADVLLAAAVIAVTWRRNADGRWTWLFGWVVSYLPAALAFAVTIGYANSLTSGCPA